jgi:threonine/homoserine/homoserine lactone efflux protein
MIVRLLLGMAGACFLLRLAWGALQEARQGSVPDAEGHTARGDFATGAVFCLASPFPLAFWGGIGGGLGVTGTAGAGGFVVLFAGFMLGALLWCLALPVAIGWGRRVAHPTVFRAINALTALALGYFGARLLWESLHAVVAHPMAVGAVMRCV